MVGQSSVGCSVFDIYWSNTVGRTYWASLNGSSQSYVIDLSETQLPAVRNMTLADMMHDGLRSVAYKALFISDSQDASQKQEVTDELKEMSTNIKKYVAEISSLNVRTETQEAINSSRPEIDAYVVATEEIVGLALAGKKEQSVSKLETFEKAFSDLEEKLEMLGSLIEKDAEASRETAKVIASDAQRTSLILIFLGVAFGLISSIWFTSSLSKSLSKIADHLSDSANQLTSASNQIAVSSKDLSESASQQSSSLEQTAASLEQITAMISKASEGAQTTSESSEDSQRRAEEGRGAAAQMLTSMDEISRSNTAIMEQVNSSQQQMSEIVRVIQEIGSKTKVINEIVFQTKLLSFNASVEAARAGEHGKGFAVVAEEVGSLAQMSGNAAKEISDMLNESISKVESIVQNTTSTVEVLIAKGKDKVDTGVQVAQKCSDLLNEIVQNISRVSALSHEISVATKEQAQGVGEINKAMGQLDSATQKTSSSSQETAESAAHLSDQAELLRGAVGELITIIEGGKADERKAS